MMSVLTAPSLLSLSCSVCAASLSWPLASTNIFPLESDSWFLPWSEAGVGEFPFFSNSVRNMNAQHKADTPGPRVPSSALSLLCPAWFQKLNGFFLIWKLISGQKEIWLHRGQICVVSQRGCNYTVDQTDSFVFGPFFPSLMSPRLPGEPAAQVSLAAEQEMAMQGPGELSLVGLSTSQDGHVWVQPGRAPMDPGFGSLVTVWRQMVVGWW